MLTQGPGHVNAEKVKARARDIKALFEESDTMKSKAFLRTFIKRIETDGVQAKIDFTLPIPPQGDKELLLPTVTPNGEVR